MVLVFRGDRGGDKMTCIEMACPKCGTKYFRGVFDGGCPKCSMFDTKSWEAEEEK